MEMYIKYKKPIVVILAVAICSAFAFIREAKATSMNGELRGALSGQPWILQSAVLKKKLNEKSPLITLELSDLIPLERDICKDNPLDANKIVIDIPILAQDGLVNVMPDYENATIHLKAEVQSLVGYQELKLNAEELNSNGLAYVSGDLQLQSSKTRTELAGSFKARVCN